MKDRLRVDLSHLLHPQYGSPELAHALMDNPAEFLPYVSLPNFKLNQNALVTLPLVSLSLSLSLCF